jgi:hypothetical protein
LEVREAADAVRSLQASRGSGGMCGLGSLEVDGFMVPLRSWSGPLL